MAKTTRRILIAIALLLLLLMTALLLGAGALESKWARGMLENQLSERLEGRDVNIGSHSIDWGWPPVIRAQNITIANTSWASHDSMLVLDEVAITPQMSALLSGELGIRKLELWQPQVHLARREDGSSNWGALITQDSEDGPPLLPQILTIEGGLLTYQDAQLDTSITLDFHTTTDSAGDRQLVVSGGGHWQDRPLQFQAWGAAPLQVFEDDSSYPVELEAQLGDLQLGFSGAAQDPLQPRKLSGHLTASAPSSADIAGMLGRPDLSVPEFTLQGLLARDGQRWALKEIDLQAADSHLTGELIRQGGDTPRYEARLQVDQLDLNRWDVIEYLRGDSNGKQDEETQELSLAERLAEQLTALRGYRGHQVQLDLSVAQLNYANETLSDVVLQGSLNDNRIEIQQLQAIQGDGAVVISGEVDFADKAMEGSLDVRVEQLHLGQALAAFGHGTLGTLQGDLQAHFVDGVLTLRDSSLAYDAPAHEFSVQLNAEMADISGTQVPGVHVEGSGMRSGEPFRFDLLMGPLLDMTAPNKPYPVKGTLASLDSRLQVDGTVTRPLQLVAVDAQFTLEGPNPARINQLTRLSLPSLPPYHIEGRLRWQDEILRLTDFTGEFGESDLAGDLRLRTGERAKIWATLHSHNLNYDDLRPLWGSPPDIGPGEVASKRQERMAREQERSGRFFSDEPWSLAGLKRMDAVVDFSAEHVNAKGLPLQELAVELELHNGLLTLQPLKFGLGGGTVDSYIRIDTLQSQVTGKLDASARGVNLSPLLREKFPDVARDSAGIVGAKADLSFSGLSMADFMAGMDGKLELAMSGGHLDMVAVEVLGLDAGEALVASLAEADQVPIRCAYLRFKGVQGQARLEQLFIDTDDSNFTGGGFIDLRTERINLEMESHSKDMSFFSGNSPVQLTGTLGQPVVSVTSPELLARGVVSAIGLIVAPPLAILPWLNPGLGEGVGAGCNQVLEEYRSAQ